MHNRISIQAIIGLVQCLAFHNMDRLITAEHVKTVQTYYKNAEFVVGAFCALQADYGRRNRLSERIVGKTVNCEVVIIKIIAL